MTDNYINYDGYFEWLYELACGERFSKEISYRRLLRYLYETEFIFYIPRDVNRAEDGKDLRNRYQREYGRSTPCDNEPCSVLEMILALSIRCEETIMDDPGMGNRTGQWFWEMIRNLGLSSMYDSRFDKRYVKDAVTRFLEREYEPNGKGGLFYVKNADCDLRTIEIWYQLCRYLDNFI